MYCHGRYIVQTIIKDLVLLFDFLSKKLLFTIILDKSKAFQQFHTCEHALPGSYWVCSVKRLLTKLNSFPK